MAPKKREKDPDTSKNPRIDHIQADHELFLQAFESMYYLLDAFNFLHKVELKPYSFQSQPKFIDISVLETCVR